MLIKKVSSSPSKKDITPSRRRAVCHNEGHFLSPPAVWKQVSRVARLEINAGHMKADTRST